MFTVYVKYNLKLTKHLHLSLHSFLYSCFLFLSPLTLSDRFMHVSLAARPDCHNFVFGLKYYRVTIKEIDTFNVM